MQQQQQQAACQPARQSSQQPSRKLQAAGTQQKLHARRCLRCACASLCSSPFASHRETLHALLPLAAKCSCASKNSLIITAAYCDGPAACAMQACNAAASERQQLRQLESQVARLAGVLRQLLISVSSSGSMAILEPPKSGTPPIMVRMWNL
jgi:hypothetical protein